MKNLINFSTDSVRLINDFWGLKESLFIQQRLVLLIINLHHKMDGMARLKYFNQIICI